MFHVPNKFRVTNGRNPMYNSTDADGNNGQFLIRRKVFSPGVRDRNGFMKKRTNNKDIVFLIVASDGLGWEHVSVSILSHNRSPLWEEMCWIKDQFWDKEDVVVQYHPPESEYVNNHKYCLHMWRPTLADIPVPDSLLVGVKMDGHGKE